MVCHRFTLRSGENGFTIHHCFVFLFKPLYTMKLETSKILQRKKKAILEQWMKNQLADETLREDLMSNDALREQSEELLNALLTKLNDQNIGNPGSSDFDPVIEILSGISITRARQGFSPRETGVYVLSLKEALLTTLQSEMKEDVQALYTATTQVNRLVDSFSVVAMLVRK